MNLKKVLNLMLCNRASCFTKIKLREYGGNHRIFYSGNLVNLVDYMANHDSLDTSDGFPYQVESIHKWSVVEILVDKSIEEEADLPDYNKGKIIVII